MINYVEFFFVIVRLGNKNFTSKSEYLETYPRVSGLVSETGSPDKMNWVKVRSQSPKKN
jgi:hypothetical protein